MGNVKDPTGLTAFLAGLGHALSDEVQRTVRNRFALERYLGNAERALTDGFLAGLRSAAQAMDQPVALLIDTYEDMEGLDPWVCSTLAAGLPTEVPLVILGRNQVHRINFDWHEFGDEVEEKPLAELPEPDARTYLQHYGLTDPVALDRIYQYTGGYPLLLVLVRQLASEAGGWQSIGTLDQTGDRDYLATQLLERILREERAREVRAFLEKGAVAPWFNPEIVAVIMDLDPDRARELYDRLRHHSFVERHAYGLRLHDKIRQLLEDRLQATSQEEYRRLKDKLAEYHAAKAGWTPTSSPTAGTG